MLHLLTYFLKGNQETKKEHAYQLAGAGAFRVTDQITHFTQNKALPMDIMVGI